MFIFLKHCDSILLISEKVNIRETCNQIIKSSEEYHKNTSLYFKILCWTTLIPNLGHMWPAGCGLDISALDSLTLNVF